MKTLRSVRPCIAASLVLITAGAFGATIDVRVSDAAGNAVENAVVFLDPLESTPLATHDTAVIDQINQQFVPRLSVVRTGTAVAFPNSDRVRHQVYSFSPAKTFTIKLYAGSPKISVTFDKPGLIVLGCNIHDSMVGFLAVVDTPYFGKSSALGTIELKVPSGRYRVRAWHENEIKPFESKQIDVAENAQSLPLKLDLAALPGIPAPWPE